MYTLQYQNVTIYKVIVFKNWALVPTSAAYDFKVFFKNRVKIKKFHIQSCLKIISYLFTFFMTINEWYYSN